jgi:hypothetical protein
VNYEFLPIDAKVLDGCRYAGECRECRGRYAVGDTIIYAPGYAAHWPECPEPATEPTAYVTSRDEPVRRTTAAEEWAEVEALLNREPAAPSVRDRVVAALEGSPFAEAAGLTRLDRINLSMKSRGKGLRRR